VRQHDLEALAQRLVVIDDHEFRGHWRETYTAFQPNAAKSGTKLPRRILGARGDL
jgi:hypothetical protein